MYNLYKFNILILVVVLWVPSTPCVLMARGPDQGRVNAYVNKLQSFAKDIEKQLSTPLGQAGLEMAVWNLYKARINRPVTGKEHEIVFQKGFLKAFTVFQNSLHSGKYEGIISRIKMNLNVELAESFIRNKPDYNKYIYELVKMPIFPPNISPDIILVSQYYFSLLLFDANVSLWEEASRFSYIWPFCD